LELNGQERHALDMSGNRVKVLLGNVGIIEFHRRLDLL
jgi:hypothetical protein